MAAAHGPADIILPLTRLPDGPQGLRDPVRATEAGRGLLQPWQQPAGAPQLRQRNIVRRPAMKAGPASRLRTTRALSAATRAPPIA
jgi:hypothetical protein